jgi:hypothetical protein
MNGFCSAGYSSYPHHSTIFQLKYIFKTANVGILGVILSHIKANNIHVLLFYEVHKDFVQNCLNFHPTNARCVQNRMKLQQQHMLVVTMLKSLALKYLLNIP